MAGDHTRGIATVVQTRSRNVDQTGEKVPTFLPPALTWRLPPPALGTPTEITMGMVLSLSAVSDATIERLHAHPTLVWQIIAPDDPEPPVPPGTSAPGWLARLFGGGSAPPPAPAPLSLEEREGVMTDLDKAWHGIHFLFTGTAWEGEPPLSFLLAGGREVGQEEVGYGPARTLTSSETREIATALARVDDADLRARFAPAEMMRLEIYPEIWDRDRGEDDTLAYLMEYLAELRRAVKTASDQGMGLLITIT